MCPFGDDVNNSEPADAPESLEMQNATSDPAYTKADDPRHAEAVQKVRELHLERDPVGEQALPSVEDARENAGVVMGELPAQVAEGWDSDAEADFLTTMVQEGIPPRVIQAIVDRYQEWLVPEGRFATCIREGDEKAWRGFLKEQGLPEALVHRIVTWYLKHAEAAG